MSAGEPARPARKTLWVVQQAEDGQPAFALVLAGYGDAWAAVELGRGMGPGHTLFALQPPDDEAAPFRAGGAVALAALYVRHLQAERPHGPYFLGGYSAGALLALEMASQLERQGEQVSLLVMLDPLFVRYSRLDQLFWLALTRVVLFLAPYAGGGRTIKVLSAMVQDQGLQRHVRVLEKHVPQPYAGRVTLIEARWSAFLRRPGSIAAWKRIARGGLDRHHSTGTHHSFMRPPHVGELGKQLVAWVAQGAGRLGR